MEIKRTVLSGMRNSVVRGVLALSAVCAPFLANAQMQSLDSTRNGTGTLNFHTRSSSNRISRVRVFLNSNRRADVTILSGARETFSGTWRSSGLTKVYLDIDRVGNDRATGTGQVIHDARGEFASVFCSGIVGDRKFDFKFDADTLIGGGAGGGAHRGLEITSPRDGASVNDSSVDIRGTSRGKKVNVKVYDDNRRVVFDDNVNVKRDEWSTRVRVDRGRYRVTARDMNSRRTDEISFTYRRGGGDDGNGDVTDNMFIENARTALRDRFRGYDLTFSHETVGPEVLGNRTVKGKTRVSGRGSAAGTYDFTVSCGASSGSVKSVHYNRK